MRKNVKVIAGAAVVGLVTAGGAFAFWSASGAGTGTASAAADTTPIVVVQTSSVAGLTPGGAPVVLSGNFNNLNGAPVSIQGVGASIASVTPAACAATNYAITGTATYTASVPAGTGVGSWSGQTIQLKDTGVLQDECKGAVVTIAYSTAAVNTFVGNVLTVRGVAPGAAGASGLTIGVKCPGSNQQAAVPAIPLDTNGAFAGSGTVTGAGQVVGVPCNVVALDYSGNIFVFGAALFTIIPS